MTASALLHHLFPWEIAPGVSRDDGEGQSQPSLAPSSAPAGPDSAETE